MKRLSDLAKPWVVAALREFEIPGEEIRWELSIDTYPDPTREDPVTQMPQMIPVLVLYLEKFIDDRKSAYASPLILPYGLTKDRVRRVVELTLKTLRSAEKNPETIFVEEV